jgi:transmembrane sensor
MGTHETAAEIETAAHLWVVRLDREGETPTLLAELEDWLAADTRRQGAFLRAQALWLKLDRAALGADAYTPPVQARVSRRQVMGTFGAAGLAVGAGAIAAGLGYLWLGMGDPEVTTARGEVRHTPLADGSTVDANTSTHLTVALRKSVRRIRLTAGEAWFQVEKDPDRPFIVEAGLARVRAVGTAFSVRRLEDAAEVFVSEGIVRAWAQGDESHAVQLVAGERAILRRAVPVHVSQSGLKEIERKLSWREGRIELGGETLAEAVQEFNRYNSREIVIADPALARKRFYGVFRTGDVEGFARSVHTSMNVTAVISEKKIVIGDYPREDANVT